MRICHQCHEEYEKGTGSPEIGLWSTGFTERFCSDSCAEEYENDMTDGDPDDEDADA